ncbi:FAD-linked oxidoreductase [Lachnellula occidentalis]|uniref:FAD-linked oxidoreductase n=1 Tax=Lachnellula occidentalis TaxID=215460 RepID=A0A8H8RTC8_9HELO|nr:FAD-linked oxidoreductase [Lachnellula occidentalis]
MSFYLFSSVICLLFAPGGFSAAVGPSGPMNVKAALTKPNMGWTSPNILSFPGQQSFANATERWTVFDPPTYSASITVRSESDVVKAVNIARDLKVPFLATGGRHGYGTTLGRLQNGISIDLSLLKSVSVNKDARTMTIGGGVRFRDMVDPLFAAGLQIQTGTCSCPGMVGVTIGAGIGRLQGVYGLLSDALISATVVTASGKVIQVSENSHSDLFWGIRGAGANFGVITSATYRVQPLINDGIFTSIDLIFPASKNVSYFNTIASMVNGNGTFPAKLALISNVLYNTTSNQTEIVANMAYAGPQDEALRAMAPVLALQPVFTNLTSVSWKNLNTATSFGLDAVICEPNGIRSIYSAALRTLSAESSISAFEKLSDFYAKYPEGRGTAISLESFPPQKVREIADSSSAYPWRQTATYLLVELSWQPGSTVGDASKALALDLRKDFAATSGYPDLSVYVNYAHGDEKLEQIYSAEKLPRLAALKKTWDPENLFAFNNPLPTHYP